MSVAASASAKVNLFLDVVGKRADGYHELSTLFHTISLADTVSLSLKKSPGIRFQVAGSAELKKLCPANSSNLVFRAAEKFFQAFRLNPACALKLQKIVPVQAGLGGGSADAAAALALCARQFLPRARRNSVQIRRKMAQLAATLGADVPFFLRGGFAAARGIGEKITTLPSPRRFWLVVVKPHLGLATPQVYRWLDEDLGWTAQTERGYSKALTCQGNLHTITAAVKTGKSVENWAPQMWNAFEPVVFARFPELSDWKQALIRAGAAGALLSGSGSALFGVCPDEKSARSVKNKLPKVGAQIWVAHSVAASLH